MCGHVGGARGGGIGLARTGQGAEAVLHIGRDEIAQATVDFVEALARVEQSLQEKPLQKE